MKSCVLSDRAEQQLQNCGLKGYGIKMKAFSCVKFVMCLLKFNKVLCFARKAVAIMLTAAAAMATLCLLTDNKKSVKKCISKCTSKLRAVM